MLPTRQRGLPIRSIDRGKVLFRLPRDPAFGAEERDTSGRENVIPRQGPPRSGKPSDPPAFVDANEDIDLLPAAQDVPMAEELSTDLVFLLDEEIPYQGKGLVERGGYCAVEGDDDIEVIVVLHQLTVPDDRQHRAEAEADIR